MTTATISDKVMLPSLSTILQEFAFQIETVVIRIRCTASGMDLHGSPPWTSRKQESHPCRFRFYLWLNSAVTLSIACCTYRSITTKGRLTFPLAYLKRVVCDGPSSPITRWNSRHILSQLQDVLALRRSSCFGSAFFIIVGVGAIFVPTSDPA